MKGIRIRLEKTGLKSALFDLEAAIMDIVWTSGWQIFAVSDVLAVLERDREIAYTTVMTTVSRLFEKGLLARRREGRKYVYWTTMGREEFARSMARDVMQALPEGGRTAAFALLVESIGEGNKTELDELQRLIAKRRREL